MNPPKFTQRDDIIQGLVIVDLDMHWDERGQNYEGYNEEKFQEHPAFRGWRFRCDSYSRSNYRSWRGLHGDKLNKKLIWCDGGEIQVFVVDTRKDSPTYKNIFETILNGNQPKFLLLETGVVNGHLCLSSHCKFNYKLSDGYVDQKNQIFINKDELGLDLKIKNPIMSNRDIVPTNYFGEGFNKL